MPEWLVTALWRVRSVAWWPLVGSEWRTSRAEPREVSWDDDEPPESWVEDLPPERELGTEPHQGRDRAPENARPLTVVAPDSLQTGHLDEDDEWADQLHEINQQGYLRHLSLVTRGQFGDLTRPVACQTHYEVEYLIRQLGVPEWVPERLRAAA